MCAQAILKREDAEQVKLPTLSSSHFWRTPPPISPVSITLSRRLVYALCYDCREFAENLNQAGCRMIYFSGSRPRHAEYSRSSGGLDACYYCTVGVRGMRVHAAAITFIICRSRSMTLLPQIYLCRSCRYDVVVLDILKHDQNDGEN